MCEEEEEIIHGTIVKNSFYLPMSCETNDKEMLLLSTCFWYLFFGPQELHKSLGDQSQQTSLPTEQSCILEFSVRKYTGNTLPYDFLRTEFLTGCVSATIHDRPATMRHDIIGADQ